MGVLSLTGCPGPETPPWASDSCYCDDNGSCSDYDGNQCTAPASSGGMGGSSSGFGSSGVGGSSSSGMGSSSSGQTSSGQSSSGQSSSGQSSSGESSSGQSSSGQSSSGEVDGGPSSSSSGSSSGGPVPNCSVDDDCGDNQTCSGGFCRFECTTSAECKLHDNRLNTCDQGVCKSQ